MNIDGSLSGDDIAAIAEEAYIYSFPMMMGYRYGYATFLQPESPAFKGPANDGPYGEPVTLDHRFRDVISPNADTPYSFALLDLRAGPMVLTVPEVTDRYYVMQFEDLYGHNDLYIGSRATGTAAGSYVLAGPRWEGSTPEGLSATHRFETDLVFLIGRTQSLGSGDRKAVAAVMAGYRLETLAEHQGGTPPTAPPFDWPVWDDDASRDERFVVYLNALLQFCQPPHPDETGMLARFRRIGIGPGSPVDLEGLSDDVRGALAAGVRNARRRLGEASENLGATVNGWMTMDAFGTRAAYGGDYLRRAAESMVGWGGNDRIEAFYPMARFDADGNPFDGNATYQLRLESDPPVRAFWSVTMYDTSYDGTAGYLVENPIGRYLINDTTEGLVRDADGGLTVTMQRTEPDDAVERANWLPTPEGRFYLALRLYWPDETALDGTWEPPPVVRIA